MKCPVCRTSLLQPTMIEELLAAMGCPSCQGSLVSLLYYRHWAEHHMPVHEPPDNVQITEAPLDTTKALRCPKCDRIMTKFRLSGHVANRLDVCASCDEAWLDHGEWELLEQLQLSGKLGSVFTDVWQRQLRAQNSEQSRRAMLQRLLGEEDASRVESFRVWLNSTPAKSTVLTYLYRD